MARQHLKFLVLVNLKIYYDRKPETGDRKGRPDDRIIGCRKQVNPYAGDDVTQHKRIKFTPLEIMQSES